VLIANTVTQSYCTNALLNPLVHVANQGHSQGLGPGDPDTLNRNVVSDF